jgi:hypothetical protein
MVTLGINYRFNCTPPDTGCLQILMARKSHRRASSRRAAMRGRWAIAIAAADANAAAVWGRENLSLLTVARLTLTSCLSNPRAPRSEFAVHGGSNREPMLP